VGRGTGYLIEPQANGAERGLMEHRLFGGPSLQARDADVGIAQSLR